MPLKPKIVQTDYQEDIQTIGNIEQMYQKFVVRIDRFRSLSNAPGLGVNTIQSRGVSCHEQSGRQNLSGLEVDPDKFIESRAHAFYRMLGFPVASSDGRYYNPGHDPKQKSTFATRISVDQALNFGSPGVVRLSQLRETQYKERRNVFARQDDVSIAYATLMRNTKQFLMASTGKDPFFEDLQTQPVAGRDTDVPNLEMDIAEIPLFIYKNVSHILKPFMVIPEIETAVTPNYKRRICVPFLPDVESTKSTPDDILKRPVIEYIIKLRLKFAERDEVFLKEAERLLQDKDNNNSGSAIKTTLLALSGEDNIAALNNDVIDAIQGFTSVQVNTVNLLIKSIRYSILELDKAVREFDKIRSSYNVQILTKEDGPEYGGKIITTGGIDKVSKQQQKIALMKLTELISRRQSQIQEDYIGDESIYAAAVAADVSKDFKPAISKQERERDEFGRQAIDHLRIIEIITGEVSGLGLVDILAIYTALWAIDIEYLIGFLDDKSLARLNSNFSTLVNSEVRKQVGGTRPGINKTLQEFEKILFNILTYTDKVLVQTRQTPRRARKGSVV